MGDRDAEPRVLFLEITHDAFERLERHRPVGVIGQMSHPSPAVVVPHGAVEDHHSSGTVTGNRCRYRRRVEIVSGNITTDEGRRTLMSEVAGDNFYGAVICVGDPARIPAESLDMQRAQESVAVNYTGPILSLKF